MDTPLWPLWYLANHEWAYFHVHVFSHFLVQFSKESIWRAAQWVSPIPQLIVEIHQSLGCLVCKEEGFFQVATHQLDVFTSQSFPSAFPRPGLPRVHSTSKWHVAIYLLRFHLQRIQTHTQGLSSQSISLTAATWIKDEKKKQTQPKSTLVGNINHTQQLPGRPEG